MLLDSSADVAERTKNLWQAVEQASVQQRPLSVPRRVFISYRWGNPIENNWVEHLGIELKKRGNIVVLDRFVDKESVSCDVTEFVARMVHCHVCVCVIDDGFNESLDPSPTDGSIRYGWLHEERMVFSKLRDTRQLKIVGLLRSGDKISKGFHLSNFPKIDIKDQLVIGPSGVTYNVSTNNKLLNVLDTFFKQLSPIPHTTVAKKAASLIHRSRQRFVSGDIHQSLELAYQVPELTPNIIDGYRNLARLFDDIGNNESACEWSHRALVIVPSDIESLVRLSQCSYTLGRHKDSIKSALLVLDCKPGIWDYSTAHQMVGMSLEDMEKPYGCLAHLQVALHQQPRNWHTRINAILRAYYDAHTHGAASRS